MTKRLAHGRGVGLVAVGSAFAIAVVVAMSPPAHQAHGFERVLPGLTAEETPAGLIVTSVRDGSGAASSGVLAGDRILAVDGHRVRHLHDAASLIAHNRRSKVHLHLLHDARARSISVDRLGN